MSRVELNRAEYAGTDLSEHIQRECELIDDYVEDIRATGTRVLEVGPGNGRTVAYLLQKGFSVEIIDRDAEVLENPPGKSFQGRHRPESNAHHYDSN